MARLGADCETNREALSTIKQFTPQRRAAVMARGFQEGTIGELRALDNIEGREASVHAMEELLIGVSAVRMSPVASG